MRPITKTPATTYAPPDVLSFRSPNNSNGALNPVNKVFGYPNNTDIAIQILLNGMLSFTHNPMTADEKKANKILKDKMTTIYGTARSDLVNNLGQFCSFCGIPVLVSALAVEHTLPKKTFPNLSIEYDNFLLVCPSCNSKKGKKPTYAQGKAWSGLQMPTIGQVEAAARAHFLWATDALAYRGFQPSFVYKLQANNNFQPLTIAEATNINNTFHRFRDGFVEADIYLQNANQPTRVDVKVVINGTNALATNMIGLIKQNDYTPEDPKLSDRRIMNLTKTWLIAVSALATLNAAAGTGNQGFINSTFNMILNLSASSGFYYMWVYLFQILAASTGNNFVARFVQESNNPAYFPGTNTNNVP